MSTRRSRDACSLAVSWFIVATAAAQAPLPDAIVQASAAMIEAIRTSNAAAIEARFDSNMHHVLPHDQFVVTFAQIERQIGALEDCDEPRGRPRDGVTVVDRVCRFANGSFQVRLAWTDQFELTGFFIAPVPAEAARPAPLPDGIREEAMMTGAPGWPLPGTLLIPVRRVRPPVVVLVHGSGPNDRDETIGPNKPFRDLAVGLAGQGIASLRYEKRTRALGERFAADLKNYTLDDEVVDDAVAALLLVASHADLGPVFVVGHSEGAWLAPRIAAVAAKRGLKIAGIVMLAAPLTPFADLIVYQYEFLSSLPQPAATPEMVDEVRRRRANLQALLDQGALGIADPVKAAVIANAPLPLDAPASMWLDMGRYDPAAVLLAQPRLPALLTFGVRDFQVPIRDEALWQARLQHRAATTIVEFPRLNHLLIDADGPMSPAEYSRPGHVSQALIDRVAQWIAATATSH